MDQRKLGDDLYRMKTRTRSSVNAELLLFPGFIALELNVAGGLGRVPPICVFDFRFAICMGSCAIIASSGGTKPSIQTLFRTPAAFSGGPGVPLVGALFGPLQAPPQAIQGHRYAIPNTETRAPGSAGFSCLLRPCYPS